MFDNHPTDHQPRAYVVLDIESAVLDESGHRRYQQMERWDPSRDGDKSRRGYKRSEDPLKTPRWVFQTITTAAAMILVEHQDGNLEVARFVTLGATEHDERAVVAGLLDVLADAPAGAAIASWAGSFHDVSLIVMAAMKHSLTLPKGWRWLAFGGQHRMRHVDFARIVTGGLKMKPIHMAEVAAALDIPAKLTVPPFAVAGLIEAAAWDAVASAVEVDCISTALLLARWRKLFDDRAEVQVIEDRILRQVEELRPNRPYIPALRAHRAAGLKAIVANDATIPWVTGYAA